MPTQLQSIKGCLRDLLLSQDLHPVLSCTTVPLRTMVFTAKLIALISYAATGLAVPATSALSVPATPAISVSAPVTVRILLSYD